MSTKIKCPAPSLLHSSTYSSVPSILYVYTFGIVQAQPKALGQHGETSQTPREDFAARSDKNARAEETQMATKTDVLEMISEFKAIRDDLMTQLLAVKRKVAGLEEQEEEEVEELVEEGELVFLSLLHFEIQEQSSHLETSVEEPLTFLKTEALVQSSNLEILGEQKLPSLLNTETEVHISDLNIRDAEKTSLSIDTGLNVPTKNRSRNLSVLFSLLDIPAAREEPLTQKQIAAFKVVFKVFSSTEGSIKMCILKLILHSVGINVTHQEICEALNRADIDGDGQVNFTDFVTFLRDDQHFAQSMVRPKESIIHDPSSVETLFFEVLTKLVETSALPMKSEREVVRCEMTDHCI
ncbi:uncharacterized protein LOC122458480 [Dermochelys coriacea]|uniref:uncharacterized protein LOC122458480 n=1 Tax=Dermochelys coriacea TaxID=27794 RepID=UPI001CA87370|nr:uncharacterized protein LOC122458480 [Dermochelys coriacea]